MTKIQVALDFGLEMIPVGTLIENQNKVFFKYEDSFLNLQLDLSPFKLKKTSEIVECPAEPFDGISGLFNDSLPDGWGRLLLDRKLIESGKNPKEQSVLERLSFVGKNAPGALIYFPEQRFNSPKQIQIDLDEISLQSSELLKNGENPDILDELYALGGNSVGARPKVALNYNEQINQLQQDATISKNGFRPWIIKFSALNDFQDMAKIEYAYYKMAIQCGITMSPSKLFKGKKENYYFGTQRFDRTGTDRLHFHTASGLLHDNFRLSTIDYGHVMDAANRLENNLDACINVFRLAVFNVYANNMDDHSKNCAFLMNKEGVWKFAPAFDLTFAPKPGGYQSISVAGVYQSIQEADFIKLAEHFQIENPKQLILEVKEVLSTWNKIAAELDIITNEKKLIDKAIQNKLLF